MGLVGHLHPIPEPLQLLAERNHLLQLSIINIDLDTLHVNLQKRLWC